jgi:hypothetical protein
MSIIRRLAEHVAGCFPVLPGETLDDYCARARSSGLTTGQRAMIAAELVAASRAERAERQEQKRVWVAAARLEFTPTSRQPCRVCGKYASLTHAHHIVPLAVQFDRRAKSANHGHVWLCPTHHVAIHILIGQAISRRHRAAPSVVNVLAELEVAETKALLDILDAFKGVRVQLACPSATPPARW